MGARMRMRPCGSAWSSTSWPPACSRSTAQMEPQLSGPQAQEEAQDVV